LVSAPLTAATGRVWTLALPWSSPPWSLNDRMSHWPEAKVKAEIRQTTWALVRSMRVGRLERVRVCLHVLPAQSRVRDAENPMPTLKTLCDGLVDAGLVDDDDPWRMVKEMPVIYLAVRGEPARMWLVIEELAPVPDAPPVRKTRGAKGPQPPAPPARSGPVRRARRSGP
jgi:crossover junction endodeoxyribonuclease RusA